MRTEKYQGHHTAILDPIPMEYAVQEFICEERGKSVLVDGIVKMKHCPICGERLRTD